MRCFADSMCRYTIGIARRGENCVRVVPGLVEKVSTIPRAAGNTSVLHSWKKAFTNEE